VANIYLDALDQELERRGHSCRQFSGGGTDVDFDTALDREATAFEGERRQERDGEGLGTQVLGLSTGSPKRIGIAPESLERFKAKVREMWDARRSRTSNQLRDEWSRYVRGWWGYYRLAEARRTLGNLEGWVRRHIRKSFWLRWHSRPGRWRRLRQLGIAGGALGLAGSRRGAWPVSKSPILQQALSRSVLRRYGFLLPSDLAAL
jgi:RNA-directed DNA polymerase